MGRIKTPEGRVTCRKANATGPALLARTCAEHGTTLVHVSSDYVFDSAHENRTEGEGPIAPRPVHSDLDLSKLCAAGFSPRDWEDELREYLSNLEEA